MCQCLWTQPPAAIYISCYLRAESLASDVIYDGCSLRLFFQVFFHHYYYPYLLLLAPCCCYHLVAFVLP